MPWKAGEVIRIEIPGRPKPLGRNRHRIMRPKNKAAYVGSYLPTESRNEKAVIRDFAARAMSGRAPLEGSVDMRVVAYMPIPASWSNKKRQAALADKIRPTSKPDASNIWKLAEDAFKLVVWRDDAQVSDHAMWRRYSDRPRIVIEVRPLSFEPG